MGLDPRHIDAHLPAALVARRVGVSRQLLYAWIKAGDLTAIRTAPDGRALYHVRQALEVNRDKKLSGRSHRGARVAA